MGVKIALIQPIHGQGYYSDIPRPHFLFWQPGRVVGQYTTEAPQYTTEAEPQK